MAQSCRPWIKSVQRLFCGDDFGPFSPLKTHRINLYTVNAVKVLTLLNDIMVAAKMLTSRVWCQSVTERVKVAIMCNLLVNWDKLLKMTNHYVITWKSSPICDQSKSDHDLLVPSCAITLSLKVVSQRLMVLPCRHCSYLQTVSECKKGHCNFSVTVSVKPTMIIWLW